MSTPSKAQKAEYQRRWRQKNPRGERDTQLRKLYGIDSNAYDALLEKQGGGCAVCAATPSSQKKRFSVDHCHATNIIRGILCHHCNTMLGLARDNPATLTAAIAYLGRTNG